jgi:vacuolar-type H+-ATPase subunit H
MPALDERSAASVSARLAGALPFGEVSMRSSISSQPSPPASALDQLLGVEQAAAARLAAADDDAARLIAQARADAAAADAAASKRLETELAEITRLAEAERSTAVTEIERNARRDAERYDTLPAEPIADRLVASILVDTTRGVP